MAALIDLQNKHLVFQGWGAQAADSTSWVLPSPLDHLFTITNSNYMVTKQNVYDVQSRGSGLWVRTGVDLKGTYPYS